MITQPAVADTCPHTELTKPECSCQACCQALYEKYANYGGSE